MFIVKLVYGDNRKKIKFQEDYQNIDKLRQVIKDITKYDSFQMSFIDLENEKLYLEDNHDMEYFLAQSGEQSKKIFIENCSEVLEDQFKEIQKSLEESLEINESNKIEEDKNLLKEELKELIIGDKSLEEPQQQQDQPVIYKQEKKTIKKVKWPQPVKKIKKQKSSQEMLNKLKKTLSKTERNLKKKLSKMAKQIKQIENAQKRELKESKSEIKEEKIQEQPKQHGIRVLTQHLGYVCDKCEQGPIVGIRYHCVQCPDYDLCQSCEQKCFHGHPMLRIVNQQTKQQIEQTLNNYLDRNQQDQQMDVEEELLCNEDQQKIDLLNFIFPVKDRLVQKELVNRYRHLNIEEFYQEISKVIKQE